MSSGRRKLIVLIVVIFYSAASVVLAQNRNETASVAQVLNRAKRYLVYTVQGGGIKGVMGLSVPVEFGDKRSINFGINVQAQYNAHEKWLYDPWMFYSRSFKGAMANGDNNDKYKDVSRQVMYDSIETWLNRFGRNGQQCLLQAICEASQSPLGHNGVFGEIVDAILIPLKEYGLDNEYYAARLTGLDGVDCKDHFLKCPPNHGLLQYFSFLQ